MKSITRQTCYKMKALNLTYSTVIIVNQRESMSWARSRTVGQGRTEEKVSGDEESTEQCITIPFIHKTNQSDQILNGVWGPSSWDRPETPDFSIWEVGAGLTPSLTVLLKNYKVCPYIAYIWPCCHDLICLSVPIDTFLLTYIRTFN